MSEQESVVIRRALISVSDKNGIPEFAAALHQMGVEILSTGGTYKLLQQHAVPVTEVSEYTGFPEMMAGRVKTLHPKIHGGILARRGIDEEVMAQNDIDAIDMVVVNLYPFAATVAQPGCTQEDAIENIDIGGPAMLRSAAKNHRSVTVVVNADDYVNVLEEMQAHAGATGLATRYNLAVKAFEHTAAYDGAIANHFGTSVPQGNADFPRTFNTQFHKAQELRYGENPHQRAAFYRDANVSEVGIASARQLQGKELSFNNIADTDAALETVKLFTAPTCVIVKHANPCGVASDTTITTAYQKAFATDTESAFGGIIALNRQLDGDTAAAICAQQFVEVIIAPSASDSAREAVAAKKNVRLLVCGEFTTPGKAFDYKRVNGGLLVQERDLGMVGPEDLQFVTERHPDANELADMLFSWKVAKMVKSNAIVYAKNQQTIGVGAGQMSRVNSARIAAIKAEHAGLEVAGSCMASDAFFPFRDGIDNAGNAGVSCVIQPGGSIRDTETIAAANEHNIAMAFTAMRHFRH